MQCNTNEYPLAADFCRSQFGQLQPLADRQDQATDRPVPIRKRAFEVKVSVNYFRI